MYEKVKTGVVVFIILLFIFGCMSLKTHINYSVLEGPKYAEKYKIGSENFVFLFKELDPLLCEKDSECDPILGSTASGLVFSSGEKVIFVMPAAHFCPPNTVDVSSFFIEKIIGFAGDHPREFYILDMDVEKDLCMLMGIKNPNDEFEDVKIAEKSIIGEHVYTVAAPERVGGIDKRLIFDGIFGGCDDEICMSSLPASFGSSGAGIYNMKGELVTIVMAIPEDFKHVVLSPSQKDIKEFVNNIDKEVDIYSYR